MVFIIFSKASRCVRKALSPAFVAEYSVFVFLPMKPFCTLMYPLSSNALMWLARFPSVTFINSFRSLKFIDAFTISALIMPNRIRLSNVLFKFSIVFFIIFFLFFFNFSFYFIFHFYFFFYHYLLYMN